MSDRQVLLEVARSYFLEDRSKTEIAERMQLSRFKVARLLERAKAEGVVRISVLDGLVRDDDLAVRLAEHLHLEETVVVAGAVDEQENRQALAEAAAHHLERLVQPGWTFGFSWGRTLSAIGGYVGVLPESTLVALTGSVGTQFQESPVEVLRRVAGRSRVRTMSIFAPLFVNSASTADALRQEPAIASVLDTYRRLDLAVLSVGSWDPPISQVVPSLTPSERRRLDAAGVRAEVVGTFVTETGEIVDEGIGRRRISISPEELLAAPRVLAVAGGTDKAPALAAVARARLITSLVTDERAARLLLTYPGVEAGARQLRWAGRPGG